MEVISSKGDHIYQACEGPCERPGMCLWCDGGLAYCIVCHGGEGSLPSHCPGRPLTTTESEAIYAGRLDYAHGAWHHATEDKEGERWTR